MISIDQIANFSELPPVAQEELKSADDLWYEEFHIVQRIKGTKDLKTVLFIAGTMKFDKSFMVSSYGSDKVQWSAISGIISTKG